VAKSLSVQVENKAVDFRRAFDFMNTGYHYLNSKLLQVISIGLFFWIFYFIVSSQLASMPISQ